MDNCMNKECYEWDEWWVGNCKEHPSMFDGCKKYTSKIKDHSLDNFDFTIKKLTCTEDD